MGTYDRMARQYEQLTDWYSRGRVEQIQQWELDWVLPGNSVLYVGAGPARDAMMAARRGARVTCLDHTADMLEIARGRFEEAGLEGEFIFGDLMEYEPAERFDVVIGNFLMGCFTADLWREAMRKLVELAKPGGRVIIGGVGLPRGSLLGRMWWRAYHLIAFGTSWVQRITPLLPRYDWADQLERLHVPVEAGTQLRLWRNGPVCFEILVAHVPKGVEVAAPSSGGDSGEVAPR